MIKSSGRALFACCLLGFSLALASSTTSFAAAAFVRSAEGSPKYYRNGLPIEIKAGDLVPDNVTIVTGPSEKVELSLDGTGRLISLGPNSKLALDLPKRTLQLDRGEILGSLRRAPTQAQNGAKVQTQNGFTVTTPQGEAKIEAGDFAINTLQQEVSVLSGKVDFTPVGGAQSVSVSAGNSFAPQGTASRVAPLPKLAADNLTSQLDSLVSQDKAISQKFKASAGYMAPTPNLATPEPQPLNPGTGTPGYWKNHRSAWPVQTITIGGRIYTVDQAIKQMRTSKTDRTYSLFQDLICAKLNVMIGNDAACVSAFIAQADAWMALHPVGSRVAGSSSAWQQIEPIHTKIDQYNNGRLCAPSRG